MALVSSLAVWTIQKKSSQLIEQHRLPLTINNDYGILPGNHRSLSTDLAFINRDTQQLLLAVEFKYEPSHSRNDISKNKLPVVGWGRDSVQKDIDRIHAFVEAKKSQSACSLFIDEGGYFRKRDPHHHSVWIDWPDRVSILFSIAPPALMASVVESMNG